MANGYYEYDDKSIYTYIGHKNKINVIYTIVSTFKQKNDLQRQTNLLLDHCKKNNIVVNFVYSEISSRMDLDRVQFNVMLKRIF